MTIHEFLDNYQSYSPEELINVLSLRTDWAEHAIDLPEETLYALADYGREWMFNIPNLPVEVMEYYASVNPHHLDRLPFYNSRMVSSAIRSGGSGILREIGTIHSTLVPDIMFDFLNDAVKLRRISDRRSYPLHWATLANEIAKLVFDENIHLRSKDVMLIPMLLTDMADYDHAMIDAMPLLSFSRLSLYSASHTYDSMIAASLLTLFRNSPISASAYVPATLWFDLD